MTGAGVLAMVVSFALGSAAGAAVLGTGRHVLAFVAAAVTAAGTYVAVYLAAGGAW
jgi:hypothetical protein